EWNLRSGNYQRDQHVKSSIADAKVGYREIYRKISAGKLGSKFLIELPFTILMRRMLKICRRIVAAAKLDLECRAADLYRDAAIFPISRRIRAVITEQIVN